MHEPSLFLNVNKRSKNTKQNQRWIIQKIARHHFCLAWQLDNCLLLLPAKWRLPVRSPGRLVLLWRHKFESNQSTFVLQHKACLGGYWSLTMILFLQRELFAFTNRYGNFFFLSKTNSILYNCHVRRHFWLLISHCTALTCQKPLPFC